MPQQHHIGIGGDAAHDAYNERNYAAASATDLDHNTIDTTSLNYVLNLLPLFISEKSVIVI